MRRFEFMRADSERCVLQAIVGSSSQGTDSGQRIEFLAGGTTLLDLMKLDVMRPSRVLDINALAAGDAGRIAVKDKGLRLGAMVRMSDAANHPTIRGNYPVLAQA